MSYICTLKNGTFRAEVTKNNKLTQSKTFPIKQQAEQWKAVMDKNINKILSLKPKILQNLSPKQIERYRGLEPFNKNNYVPYL